MHGHGREAICLFNNMKTSSKPDHIMFVSILAACSHAGLVAEGWYFFNAMYRDFQLNPGPEHYACMVDLLGRAGQLKEAHDFITKMPIMPNVGVWGALLGACRIHSNVEMAEVAAKHLLELDLENPGRYVLLYNIYLSSGKRKEANQIRALMKQRGVRKIAGHTTVEIKNKVLYMDPEAARTARESLDLAFHMSNILNAGIDRHTLSVLIALCDMGVNPESLAAIVKELRRDPPSDAAVSNNEICSSVDGC